MIYLACAAIAYLIGSFCASIPLSKKLYGADIRTKGSGNAGATNMARVYGMKAGAVTFALDAVKTMAAMLIGAHLGGQTGEAIAGAFCVVGHCFPIYFGFRGGKGVSVGAALGFMTHPLVFCIIMAVFFTVAMLGRKVSLASMTAAAALPLAAWVTDAGRMLVVMFIFSALLVIFMHRSNIIRLVSGTEPDFSPKKFN
mgnify:FL=1